MPSRDITHALSPQDALHMAEAESNAKFIEEIRLAQQAEEAADCPAPVKRLSHARGFSFEAFFCGQ